MLAKISRSNILVVICLLGLVGLIFPSHIKKVKSSVNLEEALGQLFIVGIDGYSLTSEERIILAKIKPGGIVLYARNYKDEIQLTKLIFEINKAIGDDTIPPLIMIDEEPGGAHRLGVFGEDLNAKNIDEARLVGGVIKIKSLGINMNLAPIADYPFNSDSFISDRLLDSIDTSEDLVNFNDKLIKAQSAYKIISTLKHFPGLGVISDDPHTKISDYSGSLEGSLIIFKHGIESGAQVIMTGHAKFEKLDKDDIATFSKKIVTSTLRGTLGFNGLIITDDLSDMPVTTKDAQTLSTAAIKAIEAGHNMVMFSHKLDKTMEVFTLIRDELEHSKEFQTNIINNYSFINDFKQKYVAAH